VRSVVLPFHDDDVAVQISGAVKRALGDLLSPDSVWWQEEHNMNAPLFHATVQEVSVQSVCCSSCNSVTCCSNM
jgi:hypothetical protein